MGQVAILLLLFKVAYLERIRNPQVIELPRYSHCYRRGSGRYFVMTRLVGTRFVDGQEQAELANTWTTRERGRLEHQFQEVCISCIDLMPSPPIGVDANC